MKTNFEKAFSFGISLNIELEEYKKMLNKYAKYISSAYFSLPCGDGFHTRSRVAEEYRNKDSIEKLKKILNLLKQYDVKLEAVINQYNLTKERLEEGLIFLRNNIEVDSICILEEYRESVKKYYPDIELVYSFNNIPVIEKNYKNISKDYDVVVIGKELLRKPNVIKDIKEYGFKIKFLLNAGCSFNCGTCRAGSRNCVKTYERNREKFTRNELYAIQSFFPWELKKLVSILKSGEIDEFKISCRPCNIEYLEKCLESYIMNEKTEEQYVEEDINNYYLWGRQTETSKKLTDYNIKEINKIKEELWGI